MSLKNSKIDASPAIKWTASDALEDFKICALSRECSLLGRKEVLSGKAKFGIFGDGKEVAQVAMARAFRRGDFRSGYYRDQTFMMALGLCSVEDFFAQLYADPLNDKFSGGRQMNSHFATPLVDAQGNFLDHKETYNVSSDISPTAGQMARALGLALASKMYRENEAIQDTTLSDKGNEISFVTIGDASTSEGVFWETINAASVMQVPLAVCVWDDGYGISVPIKYQTTKENISEALAGFKSDAPGRGMEMYTARGWDYPSLVDVFVNGAVRMRDTHTPALFHIREVTQPQGHSTSGSHERYKSKERLEWEREYDGLRQMALWLIKEGIASQADIDAIQEDAKNKAREGAKRALAAFIEPIKAERTSFVALAERIAAVSQHSDKIRAEITSLNASHETLRRDTIRTARLINRLILKESFAEKAELAAWIATANVIGEERYHKHLHSETPRAALKVQEVKPIYSENSTALNGYQVLNTFFDNTLTNEPKLMAFGEDVGNIGDVNQGFMGLQAKHGDLRVFDTGIREWTIIGQGLGLAMRGLRPIAEIQYLDYLIYALSALSDDVATLRYRSNGQQAAPLIVRTRGHRLEGVWHSGSPIGMMLNSLRGMYLCVPRNMTQAAGMYNTLLKSDDPAVVIECLNGYRLKETMPDNLMEFTVPLGVPEVLQTGADITVVTYGSCVRVAQEAIELCQAEGISIELIDAQTLLPFDLNGIILESLKKTSRLVVLDEDVPGGASAYIMQQILDVQGGYKHLDSAPVCIAAAPSRPPYGSEGDYFTKPSAEDIFETLYKVMHEAKPSQFPL